MRNIGNAAERIRAAVADAGKGLVERESLVETAMLAAVARGHVLVIGPPGTAKSEAVRRAAHALFRVPPRPFHRALNHLPNHFDKRLPKRQGARKACAPRPSVRLAQLTEATSA
jgi:hypothetical protein